MQKIRSHLSRGPVPSPFSQKGPPEVSSIDAAYAFLRQLEGVYGTESVVLAVRRLLRARAHPYRDVDPPSPRAVDDGRTSSRVVDPSWRDRFTNSGGQG